jgi:tRNA pseudouridine55 synthase
MKHVGSARSGLLLVDKPVGMTSHDVVAWARRSLGIRRIGHAGTLDPFASGLLPCCVGRATRLMRFLQLWSKTYTGVIALGEETPTGDTETATGAPLAPLPPAATIEAARRRLTGTYAQVPPAFSAKKIGGIPAHRLARRGAAPTLSPVRVTVHRLRIERRPPGRLAFAARVSTGTYLRTIARDVGRICGTGGHLETLRRSSIGPMSVRQAVVPGPDADPDSLLGRLIPAEGIPLPLPETVVDEVEAGRFLHGQAVADPEQQPPAGPRRVVGPAGRLLGIGEAGEAGRLRPCVVLLDP